MPNLRVDRTSPAFAQAPEPAGPAPTTTTTPTGDPTGSDPTTNSPTTAAHAHDDHEPGSEAPVPDTPENTGTLDRADPLDGAARMSGRSVGTEEDVDAFSTIGVDLGDESTDEPVLLRTRADDGWTEWTELQIDVDHGPDPGTNEAAPTTSDPIWLDEAVGYELSLLADVDPDEVEVLLLRENGVREVRVEETTPPADAGTSNPTIKSRSTWAARPSRPSPSTRAI